MSRRSGWSLVRAAHPELNGRAAQTTTGRAAALSLSWPDFSLQVPEWQSQLLDLLSILPPISNQYLWAWTPQQVLLLASRELQQVWREPQPLYSREPCSNSCLQSDC